MPDLLRLTRDIQDLARRLCQSVHDLSKPEKQFLWDQMRRPKHTLRSLYRMAMIGQRSTSEVDRAVLESFAARLVRRGRPLAGVAVVSVEIQETKSRAALNLAEIERSAHDDRLARETEEYAARIEITHCEQLIEALEAGGR